MKTKVILADDHKILRAGLKNLLSSEPDIEVVAEADNGRDALKLVEKEEPDIIIMDIGMPKLNGIETTKRICESQCKTKVIALSMHSDKQFITGMLAAGATGYLLKDCAVDELVIAINTVMDNKVYLSSEISGIVVNEFMNTIAESEKQKNTQLTGREREVLQSIAEGKTTRAIAEALFISTKTVEAHRKNIMKKLNLFTIPDLTKYAVRAGITSLD
ncbi:MAG: response regulator transcription factor [Ignavibacteriae bacterium]|nr:DNA-binding response regulator [Ignavibacteriota bacterium]NOG97296.1 response regulator transcription factor [Ignavibacteriota bacterium]